MRTRQTFLDWGVFLVCLGAIPLAVQLGVIDRAAIGGIFRLWPLIIVGVGVGLILRFTPLSLLGGAIAAGTFGMIIGSFLTGGFPGAAGACAAGPSSAVPQVQSGTFAGAGRVDVEINCGELAITRAPGTGWTVSVASDGQPVVSSSADNLSLKSREGNFVWPFDAGTRDLWQLTLPADTPLDADVTSNAGTSRLNLGGGLLASANVTFNATDGLIDLSGARAASGSRVLFNTTLNASSIDLALPAAEVSGGLSLNVSTAEVCLQPGAAVRITYEDTLSTNNFAAAGLVQNGKVWQSADYAAAAARVDLQVTANVSTITLNPQGGCQ